MRKLETDCPSVKQFDIGCIGFFYEFSCLGNEFLRHAEKTVGGMVFRFVHFHIDDAEEAEPVFTLDFDGELRQAVVAVGLIPAMGFPDGVAGFLPLAYGGRRHGDFIPTGCTVWCAFDE